MKRLSKGIVAALVTVLCMAAVVLAGCAGGIDAKMLVQGNLDAIYLGTASDAYKKATDSSDFSISMNHSMGIAVEAETTARYFDIDYSLAGEDARESVKAMLEDIYQHSRYDVGSATQNGDEYIVPVTVYPMGVYEDFINTDFPTVLSTWRDQVAAGAFASEAEAEAAWAAAIVDGVRGHITNMSYGSPRTVQVHVVKVDGKYQMTQDSLNEIDLYVLSYDGDMSGY